MKIFIPVLSVLLMLSCVSTKYNVDEDYNNFQKIYAGTKYTVHDKSDRKVFLYVTSVEKDSLRGTIKNLPFSIAKNDIKTINKNKTGATVIMIGGIVFLTAVYLHSNPPRSVEIITIK